MGQHDGAAFYLGACPQVKRLTAQTSNKFPDLRLHYPGETLIQIPFVLRVDGPEGLCSIRTETVSVIQALVGIPDTLSTPRPVEIPDFRQRRGIQVIPKVLSLQPARRPWVACRNSPSSGWMVFQP